MDDHMQFGEELVALDVEARTNEEVISLLGERLMKEGFVTQEYVDGVLSREKEFSTGLPAAIPVAVPHADPAGCLKTGLAVAVLRNPVTFLEMGSDDKPLAVEMVFMLAIKDKDQQLKWLRNLMSVFRDEDLLQSLRSADKKTIVSIMEACLAGQSEAC